MRARWLPTYRTVQRPEPAEGLAIGLILAAGIGMAALLSVSIIADWSLSPLTWYLARSSGLSLYLLTWFILVSGMGLTTRVLARFGGRGTTFSVHGYAFHLWYGFLLLHLLSLSLDPTVPFGPRDLFVPFAARVREPWTGLGVFAAELAIIVGASFGIRRLIGFRAWRALHWLAFPVFALALAHGLGAGTDTGSVFILALYGFTGSTVLFMTMFRLLRGNPKGRPLPSNPTLPAARDRLSP